MVLNKRFRGFLDNPNIFNFIRHIIDGGQAEYLKKTLKKFEYKNILDVGCGTGDFARISEHYTGIDNCKSFIDFCNKKFASKKKRFYIMDANKMNFKSKSFDASIIINTIHHLTEKEIIGVLRDMSKVSKKAVIILDIIPQKNIISRFFYSLDRGEYFRVLDKQINLAKKAGLKIKEVSTFKSKSKIYVHSLIICNPN